MSLFERNYMRYNSQGFSPADTRSMLWKLIGVNVVVYLLVALTSGPNLQLSSGAIVAQPGKVFEFLCLNTGNIKDFKVYTFLSAGFLHYNFWHMFFNMWGLYIFGGMVVNHLSWRRFMWLYIVGAVAGNVLFTLFYWDTPTTLCGASGAVYAVMMAAAMLEPNRRIVLLFLPMFPLKTRTMVICFTILELLQQGGASDGTAHLAHLGGFIGGLILIKALPGLYLGWDPLSFITKPKIKFPRNDNGYKPDDYRAQDWGNPPGDFKAKSGDPNRVITQKELDYLLDKVSNSGINSLSEDELSALRRAREQMKGQGKQ